MNGSCLFAGKTDVWDKHHLVLCQLILFKDPCCVYLPEQSLDQPLTKTFQMLKIGANRLLLR